MNFKIPAFTPPDFANDFPTNAPDVTVEAVKEDGLAPLNYHALSIFPEYFKINGKWILAVQSRMDTVCVANDTPGEESVSIVEFRNLKKGDKVVIGRTEDGSEGIYVYTKGFKAAGGNDDTFAFRAGRSRETAFSMDYDNLSDLLKYEKSHNGYVTWVLGSAISLDRSSRAALEQLVRGGFVQAIFCGTATAAFDLECGIYDSSWGQKEFYAEGNTNDNYYKTINLARKYGSLQALTESGVVKDGFVKACIECGVDLVIAGTIRDRFTLPGTYDNVYEAQNAMRKHTRKTTSIIMVSAVLFTIATGNMTPSYNEFDGVIRPIYMYTVDIQEFTVNKLSDRGTLTAVSIVTNGQDFMTNIGQALS